MRNERLAAQIENNFKHHAPTVDQLEKYETLRHYAREFGEMINELCPDSGEKSLALINLEQSSIWAEKAIERNPEL